jgi:hypothetical protein
MSKKKKYVAVSKNSYYEPTTLTAAIKMAKEEAAIDECPWEVWEIVGTAEAGLVTYIGKGARG